MVSNSLWKSGQGSSLRAGLDIASNQGSESVVVGLGDCPFVPSSLWNVVANMPGAIVAPKFEGTNFPPVKLTKQVWSLIDGKGDIGASRLIKSRPELVNSIDGAPFTNQDAFDFRFDIDTPFDLANARDRVK